MTQHANIAGDGLKPLLLPQLDPAVQYLQPLRNQRFQFLQPLELFRVVRHEFPDLCNPPSDLRVRALTILQKLFLPREQEAALRGFSIRENGPSRCQRRDHLLRVRHPTQGRDQTSRRVIRQPTDARQRDYGYGEGEKNLFSD